MKNLESIVSRFKEEKLDPDSIESVLDQMTDGRYPLDQVVEQILDVLKYKGVSYDVFVAILNKICFLGDNELIDEDLFDSIFLKDIEEYIEYDITSRALLVRLSEDKSSGGGRHGYIMAAVAGNNNTPIEVLVRLSKEDWACDWTACCADDFWENLASHRDAPADLLLECAASEYGRYAAEAAVRNPRLTGEMLHLLATEKKYEGNRCFIPENPNARADTLALLLEDEELEFLKDEIAGHKNADEMLLRKIADMTSDKED